MRNTEQLVDHPMAITTAGVLLANATHVLGEGEPHELLARALATGRPVFVGVALNDDEAREASKRIDDAAAEIVAMVVRR